MAPKQSRGAAAKAKKATERAAYKEALAKAEAKVTKKTAKEAAKVCYIDVIISCCILIICTF